MPINKDQFENEPPQALSFGEGTQPRRVLTFLATHPGQAFTKGELADATEVNPNSMSAVLSRLEERALVRHRGQYWAIGEDDRVGALAASIVGKRAAERRFDDDYYARNPDWSADLDDNDGTDADDSIEG